MIPDISFLKSIDSIKQVVKTVKLLLQKVMVTNSADLEAGHLNVI